VTVTVEVTAREGATASRRSPYDDGMYLCRLVIRNCKRVRELDLSFQRGDGSPRPWNVILGATGTCKTTLLRAAALAASGSAFANNLVDDSPAYLDRRRSDAPMSIEATFAAPGERARVVARVSAASPATAIEHASWHEQLGDRSGSGVVDEVRRGGRGGWFVAAYGRRFLRTMAERADGKASAGPVPARDRLRSLFDGAHAPVGTGFRDLLGAAFDERLQAILGGDRRAAREPPPPRPRAAQKVCKTGITREEDLMYYIKGGDVWATPRKKAGEAKGEARLVFAAGIEMDYGRYLYFLDGDNDIARKERAVAAEPLPSPEAPGEPPGTALIADLLGHAWLEAGGPVVPAELEGIVLIDELDRQLPGAANAEIVSTLRTIFPRLQFIVTAQPPLSLDGCDPDEIVTLVRDGADGDVTLAS
jgi:hypothetical protein